MVVSFRRPTPVWAVVLACSCADRWLVAKVVLLVALFINMCVVAAVPGSVSIIRAFRPLFILERLRNVRRIASTIVQVRWRIVCSLCSVVPPTCADAVEPHDFILQRHPSSESRLVCVPWCCVAHGVAVRGRLQVVPKILNVVILLCVHILVFGVLAYVLFAGYTIEPSSCTVHFTEDKACSTFMNSGPRNCTDYFSSLQSSLLQRTWGVL